ncbi:MAG: glycosyltransferase family 2 protein [SAR202 cluster bacterium]|mgnify:CR=1 FL=1|nr:glycosyltransferase family 2 protein [SAR202 cluster bacterium]|tara:strand:- start:612 stop:1277 length:666 start_codon:yes stop_codon:yes gene_type:complete
MSKSNAVDNHGRQSSRSRLEAVIPARNEAFTISQVVKGALNSVDRVIVVDDGSTDETGALAAAAGANVIRNEKATGWLRCLEIGVRATNAEIVVFLDGDGEHDPADIPLMVAPIETDIADMTFGSPGTPVRWSEGALCRLAGLRLPIRNSGFGYRAIRSELAERLPFRGKCGCGLMALDAKRLGAQLVEVEVNWQPVEKRQRMAWLHLIQAWWILRGLAGL